jgi:RNA polymerase sigma-B factor
VVAAFDRLPQIPGNACRSRPTSPAASPGRGESLDDLQQVACVGLVLAVDRFDVSRESSFLSYAVPTVMGEVRRHFRDRTWATRVPRPIEDLRMRLRPTTERLAHRLGRMPTARELATELSEDLSAVTQALIAGNAYQPNSLESAVDEDDDGSAVTKRLGAEEPCYELTENAMAVRPPDRRLPARERRVLIMRFFESMT